MSLLIFNVDTVQQIIPTVFSTVESKRVTETYIWAYKNRVARLCSSLCSLVSTWAFRLTNLSLNTKTSTFENSVDADEMAHNEPSHQDGHCLLYILIFN